MRKLSLAKALFLFDGQTPATLVLLLPRTPAVRLARRIFIATAPNGVPSGVKASSGCTKAPRRVPPVQGTGPHDLLRWTGHLDLRGIRDEHYDRLGGHALPRGGKMGFKHLGGRNLGIVEKPIRRRHLGVPAARGGNAGGRSNPLKSDKTFRSRRLSLWSWRSVFGGGFRPHPMEGRPPLPVFCRPCGAFGYHWLSVPTVETVGCLVDRPCGADGADARELGRSPSRRR